MLLGKRTMIVLLLIQKKLKLDYLTCIDVQSVFKERVEVKLTLKVDFFSFRFFSSIFASLFNISLMRLGSSDVVLVIFDISSRNT